MVVADLCAAATGKMARLRQKFSRHIAPSRDRVIEIMEKLRMILFPGYFGPSDLTDETLPFYLGTTLDQVRSMLEDQIARGFCFECPNDHCCVLSDECVQRARGIVEKLLVRLPHIRGYLITDVQAAFESDPAAKSADEAIFCYPGIHALTNHRVAHELYLLKVPLIPRIISEHAHSITGIDIHPGADIEDHFFMDHGTGIVIGETCQIGSNVIIYQGVTLGAKSFPLDEDGKPVKGIDRHPIVEDNVIIYSGATILGRITIGAGSVIGGNVWLTKSIPPNSKITQKQASRGVRED
ncbi:serine acetyltransferase [bacterium]|nr:serine acetyltransferase [candidate division CSSED10-310 bacterium]